MKFLTILIVTLTVSLIISSCTNPTGIFKEKNVVKVSFMGDSMGITNYMEVTEEQLDEFLILIKKYKKGDGYYINVKKATCVYKINSSYIKVIDQRGFTLDFMFNVPKLKFNKFVKKFNIGYVNGEYVVENVKFYIERN